MRISSEQENYYKKTDNFVPKMQPNKPRTSKKLKIVKIFFWFCVAVFLISSVIFLMKADFNIRQKEVAQKIDLRGIINVCTEAEAE